MGSVTVVEDGKEIPCYIIDNKLTDDWWTYRLSGGAVYGSQPILEGVEGSDEIRQIVDVGSIYYGWSEDDWRVDDDWYLQIYVASITAIPNTGTCKVIAWDRTRMPQIITSGNGSTNNVIADGSTVFLNGVSDWKGYDIDKSHIGTYVTVPMSTFSCSIPPLDYVQVGSNNYYNLSDIDIDGTSINNLCIGVIPESNATASEPDKQALAQIGVRFLVPIDKCPTGLSVGDIWPKQWPLSVEVEDAYQEYYDRLLALGQITNPDDVNSVWGQLDGSLDSALGVPDIDTDIDTNALSGMLSLLGPLPDIFPWLLAGFVAIVIIRRGVA